MTDTLQGVFKTLQSRITELETKVIPALPEVIEHVELVAALGNISNGNGHAPAPAGVIAKVAAKTTKPKLALVDPPTPKPKVGKKPAVPKAAGSGVRGRPKGSGKVPQEVLDALKLGPAKVQQIAELIGKKPNYLYRVLPDMVEVGLIVQNEDKTYSALVATAAADAE